MGLRKARMPAPTGCCWPKGISTGSCSARCWGGSGRYLCREASADGSGQGSVRGLPRVGAGGLLPKALCAC